MAIAVHIKHAGRVHDVDLNLDLPPSAFKDAIYQVTGVPPDRMKVMIKGGVLKDDTDWKKIAPKAGQTFMVIGAAGELPKPPAQPTVFLEDLDDSELAEALAKPVGLRNLGNTCYMNATIQAMRAIPELQVALSSPTTMSPLPSSLRSLFIGMFRTTETVVPMEFLRVLRQVNPQFAERTRDRTGIYAQQDAEECYGVIINSLRDLPGIGPWSTSDTESAPPNSIKFIEQYMMGQMRRELKCDEAPDEPVTVSTENVLKIECNITNTTNYLLTGIMNSLDQKVEKNSPSLGRQAVYTQHSRLTRLPTYLTVHMVRFAWRADIMKKAKIMRRVKFPLEFDALDLATDELKAKLLPASRRLREIEKERAERRKVRSRMKTGGAATATTTGGPSKPSGDVEMANADVGAGANVSAGGEAAAPTTAAAAATTGDAGVSAATVDEAVKDKGKGVEAGELEEESVYLDREISQMRALLDPSVMGDMGGSYTGLYDLVAIVTHKGAAADAGHYIGFVKKSTFHATADSIAAGVEDEDWYKFDDHKVSDFPAEKIPTLEGGGEDSSAYVLIYKSKEVLAQPAFR